MTPTTERTVLTWDQMLLGGGFVRFHLETQGNYSSLWECTDHECDDCYEFECERNQR